MGGEERRKRRKKRRKKKNKKKKKEKGDGSRWKMQDGYAVRIMSVVWLVTGGAEHNLNDNGVGKEGSTPSRPGGSCSLAENTRAAGPSV